jgi:hypothetical protein
MFELDTVELNMPRARRAQEFQEDAEARDRWQVASSRAQVSLSGKKETETYMSEEVFWTGAAFGGSGPVTKSSRGKKASSTPIPLISYQFY